MLDHVFITVKDSDRSIAFYETALKPLGIVHALDYDGAASHTADAPTPPTLFVCFSKFQWTN